MGREITKGVAPAVATLGSQTVGLPNVDVTTTPITADVFKIYWVNTSSTAITINLPAVANKGDTIRFFDVSNTFDTNNLTINRNGHNIMSAADNLVVATEGAAFDLVYYDSTQGWRILTI